ncbi:MAG: hypothetical protein AB7Y46_06985 [Armatimonadota bacterium]
MEIRNGRIRILLDPRTATVQRLEDAASGHVHLRSDLPVGRPVGLFRVVAPTDRWWSRHADADAQPAAEVEQRGGGVVLRYANLVAADGAALGIAAQLRVMPSPRPDELLIDLAMRNYGEGAVNEVRCPWVSGWGGLGGRGTDRLVLGARGTMDPHTLPTPVGNTYARNHQRFFAEYPVRLAAPWVDISTRGGGLALINYMFEPENGGFAMENLAAYAPGMNLAFGWVHLIALRPGESWQSPAMALAVHSGDWHETADRYRAWFDQQHPPDLSRPHVRSMIGFQNVFLRGFDGTPIRRLEEIPQVAAVGRRYGVDHLCVWDTPTLGNYAKQCDRDLTDYPDAERELLRAMLAQAEREGTHTSALINFRHPVAARALADPAVAAQVQRRYDGTFRTENWAGSHQHGSLFVKHLGPESWVYSPFAPEHQERVLSLTADYLQLGYSSMFYDQPFEINPDYGFAHCGHRPEHTHRDALALVARVREMVLARDPEAIIIGEECDVFAQMIDLWMSWSFAQPSAAATLAQLRYGIPHAMLSWTVDHEPERAALAFAMGMHLCLMVHGGEGTLADAPELAALTARLAELRRASAGRTTCARFADQLGLSVDADEGLAAFSYDGPHGPTVIAAAPGAAASGRIGVARDVFSAPGAPGAGELLRLDGSRQATSADAQEFTLAPNEVVVWML